MRIISTKFWTLPWDWIWSESCTTEPHYRMREVLKFYISSYVATLILFVFVWLLTVIINHHLFSLHWLWIIFSIFQFQSFTFNRFQYLILFSSANVLKPEIRYSFQIISCSWLLGKIRILVCRLQLLKHRNSTVIMSKSSSNPSDTELKEQGNKLFSMRQYDQAIGFYTKAIVSMPLILIYYVMGFLRIQVRYIC